MFDVVEARAQARARASARGRTPGVPQVIDIEIRTPAGLTALRLYEPAGADRRLIVYLHGGMWMLGDLETHDRTCRRLAAATNVRVLAVDFRRAPEYRWPAAVDDADAAVEWGNTELEATAPVLAGDSSGGHLALLLALRLHEQGRRCGGLLLACPNTDLRLTSASSHELAQVQVFDRCERGMVHGFIQNLDLVSPAAARATARWLDDASRLVSDVRPT
jgi:acetyl esterase